MDFPVERRGFFLLQDTWLRLCEMCRCTQNLQMEAWRKNCGWNLNSQFNKTQLNRKAVYLWCYITPQLLISLCLGLWPSESGTSEIVTRQGGGGRKIWRLSQKRELKNEVQYPTLFYNVGYRKGTSIRQAPVFRHLRALRKSPWKFIIWMNEL